FARALCVPLASDFSPPPSPHAYLVEPPLSSSGPHGSRTACLRRFHARSTVWFLRRTSRQPGFPLCSPVRSWWTAEPSASEPSPSPSPTEAVIERLKRSLGLSRLKGSDGHIAATVHLSPALGRQLCIDRILDAAVPQ